MDTNRIPGYHLWYLVGLITSDGCLSPDGRHIDITSKDQKFLHTLKEKLLIKNRVTPKYNSMKMKSYHIQISDRAFYEFLESIGLTSNKSLTLKSVHVPPENFIDFLRGIIDGDGNIRRWIHPQNKKEQWVLRIYSGSRHFIEWIRERTEEILRVRGKIHFDKGKHSQGCYILKYGKMAAKVILKNCYYRDCLSMARKQELAYKCINSYVGWTKSETIISNAGVLELVDN